MAEIREYVIEKYLVTQVKKHGGVAEKFISPGRKHVPDRLVIWPRVNSAHIDFVEVKTLFSAVAPGQRRDHERRRRMGCFVIVIRSKADVDHYVKIRAQASKV